LQPLPLGPPPAEKATATGSNMRVRVDARRIRRITGAGKVLVRRLRYVNLL
jgi:hypothetical protein